MVFLKPPSARDDILDALSLSTSDSTPSSVTVQVHYSGNIFAVYSDPSGPLSSYWHLTKVHMVLNIPGFNPVC